MRCFSARSVERLAGVHADLVRVIAAAMPLCPVDFMVTEGLRSKARQLELYAQGRTKPGPKVTWTLASRHLTGHAVDLAPVKADGSIDWNDRAGFDAIYRAMRTAAAALKVPLRPGIDWDQDGNPREKGETDSPHFELPSASYP
jgi:peptidoglycan L-alanyl-D-glutamate endopeptidase CwlK